MGLRERLERRPLLKGFMAEWGIGAPRIKRRISTGPFTPNPPAVEVQDSLEPSEAAQMGEEITIEQINFLDKALMDGYEIECSRLSDRRGTRKAKIAMQGSRTGGFEGVGPNLETALFNATEKMIVDKGVLLSRWQTGPKIPDNVSTHLRILDNTIGESDMKVVFRRYDEEDPVAVTVGSRLYRGGANIQEALNVICNASQHVKFVPNSLR